jgi:hypothetical protein
MRSALLGEGGRDGRGGAVCPQRPPASLGSLGCDLYRSNCRFATPLAASCERRLGGNGIFQNDWIWRLTHAAGALDQDVVHCNT